MHFPGTKAGDDATYTEWEGQDWAGRPCKFFGMRNAAGKKSGIVRSVLSNGRIYEATYFEGIQHGLCFVWWDYGSAPFEAAIFEHGEEKALIMWKKDWSEVGSLNKEYFLINNRTNVFCYSIGDDGLNLFKP